MIVTPSLAHSVPKVDLHCHLTGSIDLEFALELAESAGTPAADQVKRAYDLAAVPADSREDHFFESLDVVAELLRTPGQLETAVYRIAQRGVVSGNLRHLELFVNPTALQRSGMTFLQVRDGLVSGVRAVKADLGISAGLIACFLRDEPLSRSESLLDDLIAHRTEEIIGIGLDGPELEPEFRPERFVGLYERAGRAEFRRTAHFTETLPRDLLICLEQLGCERVDHGYPIIDDPEMLSLAVSSGVPFTCCPTITRDISSALDPRFAESSTHPIGTMLRAGVNVVLGTDDGALVGTDIGTEYHLVSQWYGFSADDLVAASLRGAEAAWLPSSEKAALRADFMSELIKLGLVDGNLRP